MGAELEGDIPNEKSRRTIDLNYFEGLFHL